MKKTHNHIAGQRVLLLVAVSLFFAAVSTAQSVKKEIFGNIRLSGSNLLAYPNPSPNGLTPTPKGLHPFYISHYGRHGSRYLISRNDYEKPCKILAEADSLGKLTPLGRDVLRRIRLLRDEASGRLGELTPLGAEQHRAIARRMYGRFPEVFSGNAVVDARSTVVIRCILSMENELQELAKLNPRLIIRHDASQVDMDYLNHNDRRLSRNRRNNGVKEALDKFYEDNVDWKSPMPRLFNDTTYVNKNVDARQLNDKLLKLASSIQNCPSSSSITLYDLFTDKELYGYWRAGNASWYADYGHCTLNGGKQPYSQRHLLRRMIADADSCLALEHPGATLRFGHEVCVLPLVCLMGINGYDLKTGDFDSLERKGWVNYRIFPMGSNVQLVFFRKDKADKDILLKVLLNENEATLPVKTDCAPLYHWRDVRQYLINKLDGESKE